MGVQIQGKDYDLKFTDKRIEVIESLTGKPLMANLFQNNGMLGLADMKIVFVQGLKEIDGEYVTQKFGEEAFTETLHALGYVAVAGMLLEALERDCGFFFRGL